MNNKTVRIWIGYTLPIIILTGGLYLALYELRELKITKFIFIGFMFAYLAISYIVATFTAKKKIFFLKKDHIKIKLAGFFIKHYHINYNRIENITISANNPLDNIFKTRSLRIYIEKNKWEKTKTALNFIPTYPSGLFSNQKYYNVDCGYYYIPYLTIKKAEKYKKEIEKMMKNSSTSNPNKQNKN